MAITEVYVTSSGDGNNSGSDLANAMPWATMIAATGNAGTRYNINGAIAGGTSAQSMAGSGTATNPIIIRGYSSTIGDGYQGRTNGNGPLVTTNMPQVTYTSAGRLTVGTFTIVESLQITAAASGTTLVLGADSAACACSIVASSTNASAAGLSVGARGIAYNNDVTLTGASGGSFALGALNGVTAGRLIGNRVIVASGSTAYGILVGVSESVVGNLVYGCGGHHIWQKQVTGAPCIIGNTCVDSLNGSTVDGINIITGATVLQCVIGNQLTDCTQYGLNGVSTANAIFTARNRYTRNTSGAIGNGGDWITATSYNEVTTAQSGADAATQRTNEYVSPGSSNYDYRLKPASYAIGVGIPFMSDIGACQSSITIPAVGDVQTGSGTYGYAGSLVTPTCDLPTVSQVQSGVGYGAGGTEFTGTYAAGATGPITYRLGLSA